MADGKKVYFAVVFLVVFLMIFIIGIVAQVSLAVGLERALMAAALFTGLCWAISRFIKRYVVPDIIFEANDIHTAHSLGNNLDIKVSEPASNIQGAKLTKNNQVPEFIPTTTNQIHPQVEKIINSDPKRLAEIVKKMGFEE